MIEAVEKQGLDKRTRDRSALTWRTMNFGGVLNPLLDMEAEHDSLGSPIVESYMGVVDAEFTIKEGQRDKTHQLSLDELDQTRVIADKKATTERAKLAIHHATTEYTLSVQIYEAKVKANLMSVKEYAALVEREALIASREEAALALDKEALHLVKVEAEIFKEYLAKAQVEADIAKAQVDVAKANVRALEADLAAGEAEIKLVEAQTKVYIMAAEKATLQADVAMIFAEIMTKQLSTVKLDVGKAEIVAGFRWIQTKLDDMLALYDIRVLMERMKADAEAAMQEENKLLVAAEEAYELLKKRDIDLDLNTVEYNIARTGINITHEQALKELAVNIRKSLSDTRTMVSMSKDSKQTFAQALVNAAQRYVHKNMVRITSSQDTRKVTSDETISAGR